MSAIFGFAYLDGRPAPAHLAEAMSEPCRRWGPDGCAHYVAGSGALGHALLAVLPEDQFTAMPVVNETAGTVLVATGRLDNRDELCYEFALAATQRARLSDTALIALAFERWGEDCAPRLFGEWTLAVWSWRRRRLFVTRDQLALSPLCFWHRFPLVAFASDADALFQIPEIARRVDAEHLARFLLHRPGTSGSSFYEGVQALRVGHDFVVSPEGLKQRCFWRIQDARPVRFARDDDYVDAFLGEYRRAVRTRLRAPRAIATTLSSGLDSSSIAALAAEALAESGRELVAITAVPRYGTNVGNRPGLCDEGPLANTVARRWPNIRHVLVDAADRSPVRALEESLAVFSQPLHGAVNMYWILETAAAASAHDASVLLFGWMGNCGVSWTGGPASWTSLLSLREWWSWREPLTSAATLATTVGRLSLQPWRNRRVARAPSRPLLAAFRNFLSPELGRELECANRLRPLDDWPQAARLAPNERRHFCVVVNASMGSLGLGAFGWPYRLDRRGPAADVRLLEYCFGVPGAIYRYGLQGRMLLRRAMKNLLPDDVRLLQVRGQQASDIASRLRRHRSDVARLMKQFEEDGDVRRYLNLRGLRDAWQQVEPEPANVPVVNISVFMRALMAGLFVLRVSRPVRQPAAEHRPVTSAPANAPMLHRSGQRRPPTDSGAP